MHTFDLRRFTPAVLGLAAALLATSAGAQRPVASGVQPLANKVSGGGVAAPRIIQFPAGEHTILNGVTTRDMPEVRPIYQQQALSEQAYEQLKLQAGANKGSKGVMAAGGGGVTPMASAAIKINTFGLDNIGAAGPAGYGYEWIPADDNASFGPASAVEPLNSGVRTFNKSLTAISTYGTTDLNSFLAEAAVSNGYLTASFDPDSYYDAAAGHFIVTAVEFPYLDANNVFHMHLDIAVSITNDARGSWAVYQIDAPTTFTTGVPNSAYGTPWSFFDYPHVGFDQGNVIITSNIFDDYYGGYYGAFVLLLNKAQVYAATSAYYNYTYGLNGTLMPPRVIAQGSNGYSYLEVMEVGSGFIGEYTLLGTAGFGPSFAGLYLGNTVANTSVPPVATDPGGGFIDTLDGRIQHSPTQNGDRMFAASSVNISGYPVVQMYDFNGFTAATNAQHYIYASATSDDFNPSIAANYNNSFVVSFNSTDKNKLKPSANVNLQTRYTSFQPAQTALWGAANVKGVALKTSPYTDHMGRNGDYSSVQVDPTSALYFWCCNGLVSSTTTFGAGYEWTTNIAEVKFAVP